MSRSFAEEIEVIAKSVSNNNPAPKLCKIVGNYGDEPYSDVEVDGLGTLTYKKTIGSTTVGLEAVICFLDGNLNQGLVISNEDLDLNHVYDTLFELSENKFDKSKGENLNNNLN